MSGTQIDRELEVLFSKTYELGSLCERALIDAVWALSHHDKDLARSVIQGDDKVDELAGEINTTSFQTIARYQPVAFDLRTLEAVIRMALDLERITDLAVSVARVAIDLEVPIRPIPSLVPMGERVVEMLNRSMMSLVERDAEMAASVFSMDDMVDDYEDSVFVELMNIVMETRAADAPGTGANRLITVARILERAGDHVTNIAEHICYMLLGVRLSASSYRRPKPGE